MAKGWQAGLALGGCASVVALGAFGALLVSIVGFFFLWPADPHADLPWQELGACSAVRVEVAERDRVRLHVLVEGEPSITAAPGVSHALTGSGEVVLTASDMPAEVWVRCPDLQRLDAGRADVDVVGDVGPELVVRTGSGRVHLQAVRGDLLDVAIEHSGDVDVVGLDVVQARLLSRGSGDLQATGRADTLTLELRGSGSASLFGLRVREAEVHVFGSGDADLQVDERVRARSEASGDVSVCGRGTLEGVGMGSGRVEKTGCP